ncbi:MAG: DUF6378 domain-containing protein [Pseudomonadota bacterium]
MNNTSYTPRDGVDARTEAGERVSVRKSSNKYFPYKVVNQIGYSWLVRVDGRPPDSASDTMRLVADWTKEPQPLTTPDRQGAEPPVMAGSPPRDSIQCRSVDQLLRHAADLVSGNRAKEYGPWRETYDLAGEMAGTDRVEILRAHFTSKLARLQNSPGHTDSMVDAVAYLAMLLISGAEEAEAGK